MPSACVSQEITRLHPSQLADVRPYLRIQSREYVLALLEKLYLVSLRSISSYSIPRGSFFFPLPEASDSPNFSKPCDDAARKVKGIYIPVVLVRETSEAPTRRRGNTEYHRQTLISFLLQPDSILFALLTFAYRHVILGYVSMSQVQTQKRNQREIT